MSVEKKYKKLTDIEHILTRSGMYVGSIKPHTSDRFLLEDNKFIKKTIIYNPAFLKIFDEILINSIDESKRRGSKLKTIKVNIDKNTISVLDDGGIEIKKHKEYKEWIPEMIFSNLKAGSNFNDDEMRTGAGLNGVGSVLTNVFSTEFIISTCDGINNFYQVFSNNMRDRTTPKIKKSTKNHTQISYKPDFKQFGLVELDDIHFKLIEKRVYDVAACNPKLKIYFNNKLINIKTFEDYIKLYVADDFFFEEKKDKTWSVGICNSDHGFQQVSFVNSNDTTEGGNHLDCVLNQIIKELREFLLKKHKIDCKPSELKNHIFIFVDSTIYNPTFSSQTKEKLITEIKDFGTEYTVSDKLIQQIIKSEIVKSILDWYQQKKEADENKELRKLNKSLSTTKINKLIDAKSSTNRDKCELFIIEGESAKNPVLKFRNPILQGAYPLKGKFTNVYDMSASKLIQDEEVTNLMGAIGLKMGEEPVNLRYGKIYINVDSDVDGSAIAALLVNFFYKYWKSLFVDGRIYLNITPLLVIINKKNKNRIYFYNDKDFVEWQKKNNIKEYEIDFKKGIAALSDIEAKKMLHEPKLVQLKTGVNTKDVLYTWFGDNTQLRKDQLVDK